MSCLCCLTVTLVYCGQTVGRIKMKLGMQVGLGLSHTVLDGDPAPLPPPIFCPCLLWPNGWIDQDSTSYGGRSRPGDIVLDGDPAPRTTKWGTASNFWPMSIVAKRSPVSATAEQLCYIGWQWRNFFISYLRQLFFRHVVGQALQNVSYTRSSLSL